MPQTYKQIQENDLTISPLKLYSAGWGDGSIGRVLATQGQGPELNCVNSQTDTKNLG